GWQPAGLRPAFVSRGPRRSAGKTEEPLREQVALDLRRAAHDGLGARVEVAPRAAAALDRARALGDRAVGPEEVEGEVLEMLIGLATEHLLDRALGAGLTAIAQQAGEAPVARQPQELDLHPHLGQALSEDAIPQGAPPA